MSVVLPYPETYIQKSKSLSGGEMSLKRLTVVVVVSVCAFAAHATAQKNELSGLIGRTFISDQVITTSTFSDNKLRFGDGLTYEGCYARRVLDAGGTLSVSLEVPFVFTPDEDMHLHTNPVSAEYKAFFVTPAARLNIFSGSAVSLWGSVGGGVGYFHGSTDVANTKMSNTTGVFQFGGGMDVRLIRNFSIRVEARDFWSGVPELGVTTDQSRQHNLFAGVGVVWHF